MDGPLTGPAKVLYAMLAIFTIATIAISLQPHISVRPVRNLTILGSYVVGIALLVSDKWLRPALLWTGIGLMTGLLYFGNEFWAVSHARRHRSDAEHDRPRASTILLGVVAWPIALPEMIESFLADSGVIGSGRRPEPPAP
jgi:hypothetical protein